MKTLQDEQLILPAWEELAVERREHWNNLSIKAKKKIAKALNQSRVEKN